MLTITCVQISGNRSIIFNFERMVHSDHSIHKTHGNRQSKNFKYHKDSLKSTQSLIPFLTTLQVLDMDWLSSDKPTRKKGVSNSVGGLE